MGGLVEKKCGLVEENQRAGRKNWTGLPEAGRRPAGGQPSSTRPQQNHDVTYAEKVTKDEAQIDWHQSAEQISRVIRAFNPRPIAYTNAIAKQFKNRVLRIVEAEVVNRQTTKSPGEVIKFDKDICYVATCRGVINLKKVQLSGKKETSIKDFNNAYQLIKLN